MCILCLELEKLNKKLTLEEALSNLNELIDDIGDDHANEVLEKIFKNFSNKSDSEFDINLYFDVGTD